MPLQLAEEIHEKFCIAFNSIPEASLHPSAAREISSDQQSTYKRPEDSVASQGFALVCDRKSGRHVFHTRCIH
ncbi:hypothetical protein MMC22_002835 [Lobaria immixta]|nr:hypothetical protein [Lobaria immixta]